MLRRKSNILIMLMLVFVLILTTACGGDKLDDATESDATSETDDEEVYVLRYGHDHMPDSPFQESAEQFKEIVEKESEGRIEVEIYPAEQIGPRQRSYRGLTGR